MAKRPTIYLDLDGVVADIILALEKRMGVTRTSSVGPDSYKLGVRFGMSNNSIWRVLQDAPKEFWSGIPKYDDADRLVSGLSELGDITVLTSHGYLGDACKDGKREWVAEHFPGIEVITEPRKEQYARPDALLVDDSDRKVDAFLAAGGEAVLYPRPWNTAYDLFFDLPDVTGFVLAEAEKKVRDVA